MTPEEIKALRLALGDTQESFARRMGCSTQTVYTWEAGKAAPLRLFLLKMQRLQAKLAKEVKA